MQHFIIFGLFVLFSLNSTTARAENCLDTNLVNSIQSKMWIETSDIDDFNRCESQTHAYKVLQALTFIRTIQFQENSLGAPFNANILPTDFWTYFSNRVTTITDEDDCGNDHIVAYVLGPAEPGVVHICAPFYNNQFSLVERAETMLHEARHFEGFPHVQCTSGIRKGAYGACDDSMAELGSYAVTVEALTKIALLAKGFSALDQAATKTSALSWASQVFNSPIVPYEMSSIYLVGKDQQSYFFDNSDNTLRMAPAVDLTKVNLISRQESLVIFPKDKSDAYSLDVFRSQYQIYNALGATALDYNQQVVAQRPDIIDIVNADNIIAAIYRNHVSAMQRTDSAYTEIPLPWSAKQVFTSAELGETNIDSLYVLSEVGTMYRLQLLPNFQYAITEVPNTTKGFQKFVMINGQRLGLTNEGEIQIYQNGVWLPFVPLQGKQFLMLTRPFIWSSYFEDTNSK